MNGYHPLAENVGSTTVAGNICPAEVSFTNKLNLYVDFGEKNNL